MSGACRWSSLLSALHTREQERYNVPAGALSVEGCASRARISSPPPLRCCTSCTLASYVRARGMHTPVISVLMNLIRAARVRSCANNCQQVRARARARSRRSRARFARRRSVVFGRPRRGEREGGRRRVVTDLGALGCAWERGRGTGGGRGRVFLSAIACAHAEYRGALI